MYWFTTIGNARAQAQANAVRDDVSWVIVRDDEGEYTYHYDNVDYNRSAVYCHYGITDTFDSDISSYTLIDTIKSSTSDPDKLNVSLSKEQWLLVKEMLDIDDDEANMTPEKQSLLDKLKELV